MAYSTIKQRVGECTCCGKSGPLTKRLCQSCYWTGVRLKSANKETVKSDWGKADHDLDDMISLADAAFSKYIRYKAANDEGYYNCFICGVPVVPEEGDNMHFIKRSVLYLRYDTRNCKAGCKNCNQLKGGNYLMYVKRLEEEAPGITEILMEESRILYKPTKEELRAITTDYNNRLKKLK